MLPSTSPSAPSNSAAASFFPIDSAKSCTLFAFPVTWTFHRHLKLSSPNSHLVAESLLSLGQLLLCLLCFSVAVWYEWGQVVTGIHLHHTRWFYKWFESTLWKVLNESYIVKVVLELLSCLKVCSEGKVVDPWALAKVHSLQDQGWILGDAVRIQRRSKRGKCEQTGISYFDWRNANEEIWVKIRCEKEEV